MAERKANEPTQQQQQEERQQRDAGEQQEPEKRLSAQAQFSTYSENTDLPEENPPLGRHVVQELGEPTEGPVQHEQQKG